MRNILLLSATVVLIALCSSAQPQNTPPVTAHQATIRGCLIGSAGQYRLVDDNHIVYRLIGQDKELSGFDGQQVEVRGKEDEGIPPKEKQTASSFSRPERQLAVAGITKMSDACTGASE